MINAKQGVVTLDLVLHERLVADDEAILDKLLERLSEGLRPLGLLVQTPRGIGAVLVLERGLAFGECLGARGPDVALARDRCLGRELLSRLRQQPPVHGHLRHEYTQMREVGDEPRVAEPRGTPDCCIHHGREPDRRPALALWY